MKKTPRLKSPDFTPTALAAASPQVLTPEVPIGSDSESADRNQALQTQLAKNARAVGLTRPIAAKDVHRKIRPNPTVAPKETIALRDRTVLPRKTWRSFTDADNVAATPATLQTKLDQENDLLNCWWGYRGIIEPEYDLLEPWTLLDVESYYKQSIERRLSLAFRNGFEVTGENQSFVDYINRRFRQISYMMTQSIDDLLKEILLNLYVCSNCVLIKIRDTEASGGQANEKNGNRTPIATYKIVPPQTIYPYLDGTGHISHWRRFFGSGRPYRDYPVSDVIHFYWDRKPGHYFGTPRSTTVRDDIFALRRLEENIELLLVNHLFPLFHVKVGNEKAPVQWLPSGISEVDYTKRLIQDMPKEGVLVTDERVEIDVHGAAKEGIDPNPLLEHYKGRVISGLGMSPIDLGIADTSNRATADNVSQNLKDSIIADLKNFSNQVSLLIFRDLFAESPTGLSVQRATTDVTLEWHEIDVDTQIKKETHAVNKFNSNAISRDEMRTHLKMKPMEKEQEKGTHHELITMSAKKFDASQQVKMANLTHEQTLEVQKADHKHQAKLSNESNETHAKVETAKATSTKKTKVTRKFANGGSHSKETVEPVSHAKKATATLVQPENQHGKNLDPHKARSSSEIALVQDLCQSFIDYHSHVPSDQSWSDTVRIWAEETFPGEDFAAVRESFHLYLMSDPNPDLAVHAIEAWSADPFGEGLQGNL